MGHASQNLSNNGQQDSMVQNTRFGGGVKVANSQKLFSVWSKKNPHKHGPKLTGWDFVQFYQDGTK